MDETRPEGRQERLEDLRSLYASGRYQEALAVCSQFADKNPEPNTVLIYRGMIHRALGSPAEALPAFEEWVKREPRSAAAWNHLGIVLFRNHISGQQMQDMTLVEFVPTNLFSARIQ